MKITIPFKTPTINHLYWHGGNRKFMKTEAKELREEIIKIVKKEDCPFRSTDKLIVTCNIYENWYFKNGNIKRSDVSNREKFLIDSVFLGLPLDDKQIFTHILHKCQSGKDEFSVVDIHGFI